MGIAERYEKVEEELAQECAPCGEDPKEVRLVASSKTVGVEGVGGGVRRRCAGLRREPT